jgi:hypothetical protein
MRPNNIRQKIGIIANVIKCQESTVLIEKRTYATANRVSVTVTVIAVILPFLMSPTIS